MLLSPRFDANGLVTTVVTDADDGMVLMVAHMNAEALSLTIETGIAHYWSRSRGTLWKKGETSGNFQQVRRDAHRLRPGRDLAQRHRSPATGRTCHTDRRSCFYRVVETDQVVADATHGYA